MRSEGDAGFTCVPRSRGTTKNVAPGKGRTVHLQKTGWVIPHRDLFGYPLLPWLFRLPLRRKHANDLPPHHAALLLALSSHGTEPHQRMVPECLIFHHAHIGTGGPGATCISPTPHVVYRRPS